LEIREFTAEDLDALAAISADARTTAHLLYGPRDREVTRRHLRRVLARQTLRRRRTWELAVVTRRRDRLVGACELTLVSRSEADLGYVLGRRHWGHGYATELTRALVDAAFRQLAVARVSALVAVDNEASRRVLEKSGLSWEGLLRRHARAKGRWWDCHVYATNRRRWVADRGQRP
jgi:RimJ/RimL family protein N-acetyltransferase